MVDRLEINSPAPSTVIDLDGTYINGNTLKIYLLAGIRHLIAHGDCKRLAQLSIVLLKRKICVISHSETKNAVLSMFYTDNDVLSSFKKKALKKINPSVAALISHNLRQGHCILLATAAPEFYVRTIWSGDFVATDFKPGCENPECRGQIKLNRVREWLEDLNCCFHTVVTDHLDDAPLFAANSAGTNILVNPDKKTLRFFRKLEPTHFLLIEEIADLGVAR